MSRAPPRASTKPTEALSARTSTTSDPASPATSPDPRGPPVSAFRRSPRHPAGNADSSRDRSTGRRAPVAAATVAPPRQARRNGWSCRAFRSGRPGRSGRSRAGRGRHSDRASDCRGPATTFGGPRRARPSAWAGRPPSSRSASAIAASPGTRKGIASVGDSGRGCRDYPRGSPRALPQPRVRVLEELRPQAPSHDVARSRQAETEHSDRCRCVGGVGGGWAGAHGRLPLNLPR